MDAAGRTVAEGLERTRRGHRFHSFTADSPDPYFGHKLPTFRAMAHRSGSKILIPKSLFAGSSQQRGYGALQSRSASASDVYATNLHRPCWNHSPSFCTKGGKFSAKGRGLRSEIRNHGSESGVVGGDGRAVDVDCHVSGSGAGGAGDGGGCGEAEGCGKEEGAGKRGLRFVASDPSAMRLRRVELLENGAKSVGLSTVSEQKSPKTGPLC
jgi:hypothetical protein